MQQDNRPLSPHLQVYKLPLAAKMSILHRMTGVASSLGLLFITLWLAMTASGEHRWTFANNIFTNPLIILIMFIWSGALIYHLCNGIRHLTWDAGHGLNIKGVRKSGQITLAVSAVVTLALWITIWVVGS